MKIFKTSDNLDTVFGMANLSKKRSGLPVVIWADHGGVARKVSHRNTPRAKIGQIGGYSISVTLEPDPKIKAKSRGIKESELALCEEGRQYVGRNYDLFLRHYMDTKEEFDDQDLVDALIARGEYK